MAVLQKIEPGTRVRHGSWGEGSVQPSPEGMQDGYTFVRFDVLPPCHWAFDHLRDTTVRTIDLEPVENS